MNPETKPRSAEQKKEATGEERVMVLSEQVRDQYHESLSSRYCDGQRIAFTLHCLPLFPWAFCGARALLELLCRWSSVENAPQSVFPLLTLESNVDASSAEFRVPIAADPITTTEF